MKFSFPTFRTTLPVPSLGGAMFRPKPVIPITLIGPAGQYPLKILVDTGADDIVLPMALAATVGVSLEGASQRHAAGVGSSQSFGLLFAPLILELDDGLQACRWRALVAFTKAKLLFPLFGIAGGIEYFRTTFDVEANEIVLKPKPHLPSTQDVIP